jgi:hypothetical protein
VKELPFFDNLIELYVLLVDVLHIGVHDLVNCNLLNVVMVHFCRGQVHGHLSSDQYRWKIWAKQHHIKYRVHAKERWSTQFKIILTHSLSDGVRSMLEWYKLPMGTCEMTFFCK